MEFFHKIMEIFRYVLQKTKRCDTIKKITKGDKHG